VARLPYRFSIVTKERGALGEGEGAMDSAVVPCHAVIAAGSEKREKGKVSARVQRRASSRRGTERRRKERLPAAISACVSSD